ncbi:MAG: hypothetical protein EHM57_06035 [Actinobacteria bacterium]|nr:MAG: hypothetical protein EHM57_06035 [Actinomycetota bacterium]
MALILLIVVSVVALAVRRRTEQRGVTDYLAVAEEVANTESSVADGLADLVANVSTVARPEMMSRLAMLTSEAVAAERSLREVDVPAAAAVAHGYLMVAVGSWGRALDSLDEAMVGILDAPEDDPDASLLLAQSLDHLRVGDAAYAGFLAAVAEMDPDLVTRDFHAFAFDGLEGDQGYDPDLLTARLRSVFRLGSEHDVSVTGLTDPEPVAFREGDGIPVIPFSEGFAVRVVVANEGNEPELDVAVTFALTPADGGSDGVTFEETIALLEPQKATTLTFDGFDLRPGGLYEVVATAMVGDDGDAENNTWTMVFYRNEDA